MSHTSTSIHSSGTNLGALRRISASSGEKRCQRWSQVVQRWSPDLFVFFDGFLLWRESSDTLMIRIAKIWQGMIRILIMMSWHDSYWEMVSLLQNKQHQTKRMRWTEHSDEHLSSEQTGVNPFRSVQNFWTMNCDRTNLAQAQSQTWSYAVNQGWQRPAAKNMTPPKSSNNHWNDSST